MIGSSRVTRLDEGMGPFRCSTVAFAPERNERGPVIKRFSRGWRGCDSSRMVPGDGRVEAMADEDRS